MFKKNKRTHRNNLPCGFAGGSREFNGLWLEMTNFSTRGVSTDGVFEDEANGDATSGYGGVSSRNRMICKSSAGLHLSMTFK